MPPIVASALCGVLIAGLFWLNRDPDEQTSGALWIPIAWVMLACSRSVGQWLSAGPTDTAESFAEGSPLDRVVYFGLVLLGLIVLVAQRRGIGRLLRANGAVVFFLTYAAFSLLWSDYPDIGFKRWVKAVGDVVMALIILTDPQPLAAFKRLLTRVGYVLIPLSVLFIKYYPEIGMGYGPWGGPAVAAGVTVGKNALGALSLLFGIGTMWRLAEDYQNRDLPNRSRKLLAQGTLLVLTSYLFWMSNSMTSISSFAMAAVLLFVSRSRFAQRSPAMIHLLIVSMLSISAAVVFLGASPDALAAMGRNPTLTDRTEVWGVLRQIAGNPVVGTGFESFWLGKRLDILWGIYWWHPNEAHNGYLEILLQLGWIGVGLLAVVLISSYRVAFSAWRSDPKTGAIFLCYFFLGLVYNFTEAAFFKILAPVWIFFLFAAFRAAPVPSEVSEFENEAVADDLMPGLPPEVNLGEA
jgi:exopolysaccharide production protein ExoQ